MPTWVQLVEAEPMLLELRAIAVRAGRNAGSSFCKLRFWNGADRGGYGLKRQIADLVGHHALRSSADILHSNLAYSVAMAEIYNAIEPCRNCGCWPDDFDEEDDF